MSRHHLFSAQIRERYALTKPGSTKATYHLTLNLQGNLPSFKVGDSLAIYAENDPLIVDRWLKKLQLSGAEEITAPRSQEIVTIASFLTKKANLGRITPAMAQALSYAGPMDIDPLDIATPAITPDMFAPLLPRYYSIASSPLVHPDEVHLTVSLSSYDYKGETRYGVASHFLCHLAALDETPISCYVQSAAHFTIPSQSHTDIIMIGPGTGVAPFRAFVQERLAQNASGKQWLFFGERHRATDFFYEDFWVPLAQQNKLKLDLAFSRDQAEKIYVQHRMEEQGAELWYWIDKGAYIYVCGDADPMAKEVERALIQIFEKHGNLEQEASKLYLKNLRKEKRFLADVY